jgi:redox-sensitive bicupin YhaK (pirin superfamily)
MSKTHAEERNKALARTALEGDHTAMTTKELTTVEAKVTKLSANDRGRTEIQWLHSRHSFSFGEYHDPNRMAFRSLRVLNDDIVEPGKGFGTHPHRDAEIFTYVIDGQLEHRDSMGNGRIIKTGDLQYMSAGRGVLHSEFNPSPKKPVHFLQVWLLPNVRGGEPRYAEKNLGPNAAKNDLTLLFAPEERDEAVAMRADAEVYFGKLDAGRSLSVPSPDGTGVWIHVIGGKLEAAGETLTAGDAVAVENTSDVNMKAEKDAEFLVFVLK